jgi:putative Mn2+ efflux pump MntP
VVRLVLIAAALGLSNFAASIGIGLSGVDARQRLRVGVLFGAFETGMPIFGLLLGHRLARSIGSASSYLGGALLMAAGLYTVLGARATRSQPRTAPPTRTAPLIVMAAALSVDNLAVGFALGTQKEPIALTALVIGTVSVAMSLLGLELGDRMSGAIEEWSQEIGGGVLVLVGVAIAAGAF